MGCSPEDLPKAMNDREGWRERVRDIRADGAMMMMMIYLCLPVVRTLVLMCFN